MPLSIFFFLFLDIIHCKRPQLYRRLRRPCGKYLLRNIFMVGILLPDLRIFCFLISASTFGFLFFNSPRASIFMGDAGSHMLGFLLASTGIMKSHDFYFFDAAVWLVLLASLPVFELIFITTIRLKRGMPWWKGSPDHFFVTTTGGRVHPLANRYFIRHDYCRYRWYRLRIKFTRLVVKDSIAHTCYRRLSHLCQNTHALGGET